MFRILKWAGISLAGLVLLALIAALVGWFWITGKLKSHMTLPDNNPEVASLLEYAERVDAPQGPIDLSYQPNLDRIDLLVSPPEGRRPWTRWWWPGGDITAATACAQLADFDRKGFGGVEIQAFAAGVGEIDSDDVQERVRSVGTDSYNAELSEIMSCAHELNMALYLNHLSGWPAGGPQVPVEEGLREMRFSEKTVKGGRAVDTELPAPRPGFGDYTLALGEMMFSQSAEDADLSNFVPEHRELISVVAARKIGGERDPNPLVATDTVKLDPDSLVVLTDKVQEGRLIWDAPEGSWTIIAVWNLPSGTAPVLVAGDSSGFVVDHLDTDILFGHYAYAFGKGTGLDARYGEGFTGFFNDSIEFMADRLGTQDILQEFQTRRGYDLEPVLPAVFVDVRDNFYVRDVARAYAAPSFELTEMDERIRFDYQKTISDLLVDRFVGGSADWAEARGLLSKGQSYGMDLDAIRALGRNQVPEMEQLYGGGSEFSLKLAGAAGLLYDRPIIGSESFVWSEMGYAVSPARIKAAADKLFLSGINQILYHGIPYDSERPEYADHFGEMGWHPFHGFGGEFNYSGNYGPESSIWPVLEDINTYLTRSQNLLQAGRPQADVLIYYPFLGFPSELSDSDAAKELFLFLGDMPDERKPGEAKAGGGALPLVKTLPGETLESRRWIERLMPVVDELDRRGVTWTWVNDDVLSNHAETLDEGQKFLVFDAPWIELESAEALARRAENVAIIGQPPKRQPGYFDYRVRDAQIATLMESVASMSTWTDYADLSAWGQGDVTLSGDDTVRRVQRILDDGSIVHFLANQSITPAETALTLDMARDDDRFVYVFDPVSGEVSSASANETGELALSMPAFGSLFILDLPTDLSVSEAYEALVWDQGVTIQDWTMQSGSFETSLQAPLPDASGLPDFVDHGTGLVYTAEMAAPSADGPVFLVLERVEGSVTVDVNGVQQGRLVLPPYRLDISQALREGTNTLTLTVTPPRFYELVHRGDSGTEPDMEFMAGLTDKKNPKIGILGDVRLVAE